MKTKLITLFTTLFTVFTFSVQAQDDCALKYNMLKTDVKTKNYESAIKNLNYSLDNCASLTANIYIYGGKLVNALLKDITPETKEQIIALENKLYTKRFENFPDIEPAKAHSDYADFLSKMGGDKEVIFEHYEIAYKDDPTKLGVGSIIYFFNAVIEKNKDNNLQEVFNVYDNIVEAMDQKVEGYLDVIQKLKAREQAGETLTSKDQRKLKAYSQNSKALGQIEGIMEKKVEEISTCDYLIPLYKAQYEANKTNKQWLGRTINRMFKKDCTTDPLYITLVGQYQEIAPSPEASVLYAGILMDKGETIKAISSFDKAIELESDPSKKAKILYRVANIFKKRGQTTKSVLYAKKAIAVKPSYGRAYTLIATAYAGSVDKCGNDEFTKRMVYVVAEKYALKASKLDPSIGVYASKLAKSYKLNQPSKKLVFNNDLGLKSGDSYTVKCWINEIVRVP